LFQGRVGPTAPATALVEKYQSISIRVEKPPVERLRARARAAVYEYCGFPGRNPDFFKID
jgi:hypothetical protein